MQVTFDSVTITVTADTPRAAYELLCSTLGANPALDFSTSTFDTGGADGNLDNFRDTSELLPDGD